jgi:cobalt-zinc-cadmium efflux system membrane fusion protein
VLGGWLFLSRAPEAPPAAAPDVPHIEGKRIVFSAAFAKRIGLTTTEVRKGTLTPVVQVVGTTTLDPEHVAAVGTRMRGLVRSVTRFEGDDVKKGEALAEVDSAELGEAQANVTMLRAELSAAEINAAREDKLFEQQLSTAREREVAGAALKKAEAMLHAANQRVAALGGSNQGALGHHTVVSPIDGTVVERGISTGQSVEANLVAYKVANLDHLWVELAVFERNLSNIRVDDVVELGLLSDPETKIHGRVAHIGATINPETRSADVRIEIDNRERTLRPCQAVTAEIHTKHGSNKPVTFVPSEAVTIIDGQPTVFVADTPTSVRTVPVELGKTNGEEQQITKGLDAGQRVVSQGVFELKSELFR